MNRFWKAVAGAAVAAGLTITSAKADPPDLPQKVANKVAEITKLPLDKLTAPVTKLWKSITSHHAVTGWETADNGMKFLIMRPHFDGTRLFDNMDKEPFKEDGQWSRVSIIQTDGSDENFEMLKKSIKFVPKSDVPHRGDGWRRYPNDKDNEPIALNTWFQWNQAAGKDYAMYLASRTENMKKDAMSALAGEKKDTPNIVFLIELAPPGWKPPEGDRKQ